MAMTMAGLQSGAGKMLAPVKSLGDLFITTSEKMVAMQFDSSKVYQDIAFKQLKKLSTVRSLEQAGDFFWGQIEPAGAFNKQLLTDWKSMVALNTEFTDGVKAMFANKPSDKVTSLFSTEEPVKKPVTKIETARRSSGRAKKTSS